MSELLHLFTYGTLTIPEVFLKVTGTTFNQAPAVLEGFDCYRLKDQLYPGIIPKPGCVTKGIVYFHLDPDTIKKLDQFEGDLYNRKKVSVYTDDQGKTGAVTYVLKPGAENYLSSERWSKEAFEQHYLGLFLANDPGFLNESREERLSKTEE